ncbi:D-arabinono-1,4-lactone oxidase [Pseudonocardia abyssalis]|uniref:FAD-binding protein n=1 Tax=Pseudonocardia abyssalis TaxID=2792008 RepID=A0ABS6UTB4_9PSEU|nr:D-arabinono-1,4-lactone oxidase [Pseudonocardia abyssalis]MBW0115769.1 FAD-binding protein [Pseudonocardia abyssalis]MBW0135500.1 FAD-binding protein [Pseudonocardia abyssalis]
MTRAQNWAGNVVFSAREVHRPTSVGELQELVAESDRVRALGTGHSFSPVADTAGDLVVLSGMPDATDIDGDLVTVPAGMPFAELTRRLHAAGRALPNLGSLPHISVAGACATGTHGSGDRNGALATRVRSADLVRADGTLGTVDGPASVVALGALGIVTSLTLQTVPAFDLAQWVMVDVPFHGFDHLGELLADAYSVSAFTYWDGPVFDQVWLKRRVGQGPPEEHWMGGRPADGARHMTRGEATGHCTDQLGRPGPWHERLPHFRAGFRPSSGAELQSEYLVPRADAAASLRAVEKVADVVAPVLLVSEVRSVAADDLWLSAAYGRDSVAIHFTWVPDAAAVAPAVAAVESALDPFDARPHWGKVFTTPPGRVRELWEHLPSFVELAREADPTGKFRNAMLDRYLT